MLGGEGGDPDVPPSVIYADISSPLFGQFHQTVSATARDGRSSYRVRYRPPMSSRETAQPLFVQGYGVELVLKRTDYIVVDDRELQKRQKESEAAAGSDAAAKEEEEKNKSDLKPLSKSELHHISMKAASLVMNSDDKLQTLLDLSQDFPKHSSSLVDVNVTEEFTAEFYANRELFLPPGYNMFWINGVPVDARNIDAFSLLEQLRRERKLINSIKRLGFTAPEAVSLLSHPAIADSKKNDAPQRYDYRDEVEGGVVIMWMNDLEKDKRYKEWPADPKAVSSSLHFTYSTKGLYLADLTVAPSKSLPGTTSHGAARYHQFDCSGGLLGCQ